MHKKTFSLTIEGEPQAQQRHRSCRRGAFSTQYDPSAQAKAIVALRALECVGQNKPLFGPEVPLSVYIYFYQSPPKDLSKKVDAYNRWGAFSQERQWIKAHHTRQDLDNLCKFFLDALTGIVYHDDHQIVELMSYKRYSNQPHTEIGITAMSEIDLSVIDKFVFELLKPDDVKEITQRFIELAPALENPVLTHSDLQDIADTIKDISLKYGWVFSKIEKKLLKTPNPSSD